MRVDGRPWGCRAALRAATAESAPRLGGHILAETLIGESYRTAAEPDRPCVPSGSGVERSAPMELSVLSICRFLVSHAVETAGDDHVRDRFRGSR
jgi:hypothetical protein